MAIIRFDVGEEFEVDFDVLKERKSKPVEKEKEPEIKKTPMYEELEIVKIEYDKEPSRIPKGTKNKQSNSN